MAQTYEVVMKMTLVGGIVDALARLTGQMTRIRGLEGEIRKGFDKWAPLIRGVGAAFAAAGIAKELWEVAKAGDKVIDAMTKMKLQGESLANVEGAMKKSFEISAKIKTMTPSEVMESITGSAYSIGDLQEAEKFAPYFARLNKILGFYGKKSKFEALMPSFEESGLLGSGREGDLNKVIEGFMRDVMATGGRVDPQALALNWKYARAARYGWTTPEALAERNPFITSALPYAIQMMGAGGGGAGGGRGMTGAGNAFMSSFSKIVQGQVSKSSAGTAEQLGLLESRRRLKGSHEDIVKFRDVGLFERNPYEWVQRVLVPSLKAKGIESQEQIIEVLSRLFGTRVAADLPINMAMFGRGRMGMALSPWERHFRRQRMAPGSEEAEKIVDQSAWGRNEALMKQQQSMWEAIGRALDPTRLAVMEKITDIFTRITEMASADPDRIRGIGASLLSLSAGLATLAGLNIAVGAMRLTGLIGPASILLRFLGPAGWLIMGVTAAAAALPKFRDAFSDFLAALSKGDWGQVKESGGKAIGAFIVGLIAATQYIVDQGKALGQTIIGAIGEGINSAIDGIKSKIQSLNPFYSLPPGSYRGGHHLERFSPKPQYTVPSEPFGGELSPQSFTGRGNRGALLQNVGWNPGGGSRGGTVQVNNVINLDGSALARALNDYAMGDLEHPKSAGYFDGRENFSSSDSQLTTT